LLQIANGLLKLFDEPIALRQSIAQLLIIEQQLLVRRCVHADPDSDDPCQLYEIIAIFTARGKVGLNKHVRSG
jgi:hypothetical protein